MTDRHTRLDLRAATLMLTCCALWGLQQVVVKLTLPVLAPLLQGALRSLIAALLVAAYARARRIRLVERDATLWPGVGAGVLFGLEFICIYAGLQYTQASRLIVFVYLAPFVVALGMPFVSRAERLSATQSLGLALAFAGLVFAFSENLGHAAGTAHALRWVGDSLAVAAALFWGLTTLLVRATALSTATPERTLFWQLAVSAPVLAVAAAVAGEPLPTAGWGAIGASMLYQAGVVAAASYLAWFWLLRHYPATRISAFSFLTPLFGLVFGAAVLGEPLTPRLLLALAGVAVGIVLVNRR